MTDTTLGRIAGYGSRLAFSDLPAAAVHEAKRRLIDTLGCMLGAYHEVPSRIARGMAARSAAESGARVIGSAQRRLPELAAFANGVMGRYLDGNDTYPGGGGHPSDMLAAVLAAADACRADGRSIICAIAFAYEVYHTLFQATRMRDKGMDNVFYTAVGGAADCGVEDVIHALVAHAGRLKERVVHLVCERDGANNRAAIGAACIRCGEHRGEHVAGMAAAARVGVVAVEVAAHDAVRKRRQFRQAALRRTDHSRT